MNNKSLKIYYLSSEIDPFSNTYSLAKFSKEFNSFLNEFKDIDIRLIQPKNYDYMADDKKVIFSMSGVTKTYKSANTPVLKNIYLSFFYGAKIGILGLNGSGKSTLLKIIAGRDTNYQGDVVFSSGYSIGYLEQEPELDEDKTVLEVVKEGVAETVAVLDEYNKINDMFGLPEVY